MFVESVLKKKIRLVCGASARFEADLCRIAATKIPRKIREPPPPKECGPNCGPIFCYPVLALLFAGPIAGHIICHIAGLVIGLINDPIAGILLALLLGTLNLENAWFGDTYSWSTYCLGCIISDGASLMLGTGQRANLTRVGRFESKAEEWPRYLSHPRA